VTARLRIGEVLINQGLLTREQLDAALERQRSQGATGLRLGQVLVEMEFVGEAQLTKVLSQHLSVPWVSLHYVDFSRQLLNLVPKEIVDEFCVIPIYIRHERKTGDTLYLAMEDPTHDEAMRKVSESSGLPVKPMIAAPSDIRGAIRAYYGGETDDEDGYEDSDDEDAPAPAVRQPPPPPPARRVAPVAEPATPAARPAIPPAIETTPPVSPAPPTVQAPTSPAADASGPHPRQSTDTPSHGATRAVTPAPGLPAMPNPLADGEAGLARLRKSGPDIAPRARGGPRMVALTLLDGTTIQIPTQKRGDDSASSLRGHEHRLTTRELVVALRAVAEGGNAEELLGDKRWERILAALITVLMKKQLVADWEFVEELNEGR